MTGIHSPYDLIPGDCARWHRARSGTSISPYSCLTPFRLLFDCEEHAIGQIRELAHVGGDQVAGVHVVELPGIAEGGTPGELEALGHVDQMLRDLVQDLDQLRDRLLLVHT